MGQEQRIQPQVVWDPVVVGIRVAPGVVPTGGTSNGKIYVFPTRDNNQYTDRGFKTLWQRCVLAAIGKKILTAQTRFTFHDLRAYYAMKHKKDRGALPDLHANPETTARVYDRNKEVGRESF